MTGGSYEQAVVQATRAGGEPGAIEIADVGESGPARWVVDGYQTLYAEIEAQGGCDVVLVPVRSGRSPLRPRATGRRPGSRSSASSPPRRPA